METPKEIIDGLPETDYVLPFSPGEVQLGGRAVRYESFGDEREVDALRNELLATPFASESIRGYIDQMLEYLSWPIPHDGFDFDENDAPRNAVTAHRERKEWEFTLSKNDKLRADKVAFNLNHIEAMLNTFHVLEGMLVHPQVQEQFKGPDGHVPAIFGELAQSADAYKQNFTDYKEFLFDERLAAVKKFRTFVKRTARSLIDAYRAPESAAA